jgi:hypothetical protein
MKGQPGTDAISPAAPGQDGEWALKRHKELQAEAAAFAAQLAELEGEHARSSPLLKFLGRAFGLGAGGKLERARFKVSYKQEQLAQFEALHLIYRR